MIQSTKRELIKPAMSRDPLKSAPLKMDRRVQRTRQLLRDALMALILERGYNSITVQDVTDRANLGRATFYLHFRDKEELLITSLEEIYDGLIANIGPLAKEPLSDPKEIPSLIAFEHAAQNRDLYRVMLSGHGAGAIRQRILEYLANVIGQRLQTDFPLDEIAIPLEILAHHVAGSLLALITWWLEADMPYSAAYMAQATQQLNAGALMAYVAAHKKPAP